jgi:hypothetical protein
MKQVEIYKGPEEQNGMMNILCLVYGSFINQAGYLMDHTGIFGELNRKCRGRKTLIFG